MDDLRLMKPNKKTKAFFFACRYIVLIDYQPAVSLHLIALTSAMSLCWCVLSQSHRNYVRLKQLLHMLEVAHRFKTVYLILTKTINKRVLGALSPTIGYGDVWRAILWRRLQLVGVMVAVAATVSAEEESWMGTRIKPNVAYMPTVADTERNPSDGSQARAPWESTHARCGSKWSGLYSRGGKTTAMGSGEGPLRGHHRKVDGSRTSTKA